MRLSASALETKASFLPESSFAAVCAAVTWAVLEVLSTAGFAETAGVAACPSSEASSSLKTPGISSSSDQICMRRLFFCEDACFVGGAVPDGGRSDAACNGSDENG